MDPNMMLSLHFSLQEAIRSDAAKAIKSDNMPTPEHLTAMKAAALSMEHVRKILGGLGISIKSWYRNPVVNASVGGTSTSDHANGWAIDFTHSKLSPLKVAQILRDSGLAYDQLILESGRNIVHISFAPRLRQMTGHQPAGPGSPITWALPE